MPHLPPLACLGHMNRSLFFPPFVFFTMSREREDDAPPGDDRPAKRIKADTAVPRDFEERSLSQSFRNIHHPECIVTQLIAQRDAARRALSSFLADMQTGALSGPRLKKHGLLRELPGADLAPGDDPALPPRGPPPNASNLVKFEPLPSSAIAHARGVLIAAAAGPAAASGESAIVSLLTAEPINERTRLWAAFQSREAADTGMHALTSLPQLSELVDPPPPPAQHGTIMPSRETVPPPMTDQEIGRHRSRIDDLIVQRPAGRTVTPKHAGSRERGLPSSSHLHPIFIPHSSHLHPICIPSSSHTHPICIPSASHPHPTLIPSSSHLHPIFIPSASHLHPILIPSSSHPHPVSTLSYPSPSTPPLSH